MYFPYVNIGNNNVKIIGDFTDNKPVKVLNNKQYAFKITQSVTKFNFIIDDEITWRSDLPYIVGDDKSVHNYILISDDNNYTDQYINTLKEYAAENKETAIYMLLNYYLNTYKYTDFINLAENCITHNILVKWSAFMLGQFYLQSTEFYNLEKSIDNLKIAVTYNLPCAIMLLLSYYQRYKKDSEMLEYYSNRAINIDVKDYHMVWMIGNYYDCVDHDSTNAIKYYKIAAERGCKSAEERLKELHCIPTIS